MGSMLLAVLGTSIPLVLGQGADSAPVRERSFITDLS